MNIDDGEVDDDVDGDDADDVSVSGNDDDDDEEDDDSDCAREVLSMINTTTAQKFLTTTYWSTPSLHWCSATCPRGHGLTNSDRGNGWRIENVDADDDDDDDDEDDTAEASPELTDCLCIRSRMRAISWLSSPSREIRKYKKLKIT